LTEILFIKEAAPGSSHREFGTSGAVAAFAIHDRRRCAYCGYCPLEPRGVKVINLPGTRDKYDEILAQTFKELREYMRDNVISVSKVTEERPLRDLLLQYVYQFVLLFAHA
jgi:hypothetical protein